MPRPPTSLPARACWSRCWRRWRIGNDQSPSSRAKRSVVEGPLLAMHVQKRPFDFALRASLRVTDKFEELPHMKKKLVSILSDLIALPSPYPPGTSVEICAYAAKRLRKAGYKVEIATHKKGVDNVVARLKGKAKGLVIAFNAHVDTVGVGERANWKSDPFK